ncbi:hypothetical protein G7Z17_g402 [Cylindrodendrum hubeiense]|uniref:Rhodopsin domain-containing protein n=1 Tax=Cylindrodendrum hubeiense TaxID=595255 RepID=A0A9P5HGY2_9HYPO|nr:hypothetical protein G7Z17_g402 [Cylindrodendrum hubeiense]
MPAFILWHLQLRRKLKMLCSGIMGLGVLASIATIIRMPYVPGYAAETDKLYKIGFVILWTVVELGLGILAGSLPSLRKFFKSLAKDKSSGDKTSFGTDLVTIGAIRQNRAERGPITANNESEGYLIADLNYPGDHVLLLLLKPQ